MLDPLYTGIAKFILLLHDHVLGPVFGYDSGAAWGLSIVLLVVTIRLVLFPLFVRQIRMQRRMQLLQPEIAKLKQKYKNDRQALGEATMALYKEHNANPLSGCLPLVIQAPIFYALFRVLEHVGPNSSAKYGLTVDQLHSLGSATIFGTPIAATFTDPLGASPTVVKIVTGVAMLISGLVTFLSQRLVMAQRSAATDDTQAKAQRLMLYLAPLFIVAFGWQFPLGVLLYWLTSYSWTAGQTYFVVTKMPATTVPPKTAAQPQPARAAVAADQAAAVEAKKSGGAPEAGRNGARAKNGTGPPADEAGRESAAAAAAQPRGGSQPRPGAGKRKPSRAQRKGKRR